MSNRIRNRFIALVCLLVFIAGGILFYTNWVVQKPFAIIVFLTDNLSPSAITAARIYQGGADYRLNLEKFPHLGFLSSQANDFAVSDTAAATTAIATGQKVNNGSMGVAPSGQPLRNLVDIARHDYNRAVGLVSNAALSDITPGVFYGQGGDPHDSLAIAAHLTDTTPLDVILGGGEADMLPEHKGGRRTDGRDLMLEMRQKGYDIVRNLSELENSPRWRSPQLLGVFAPGNLAFGDEIPAASSQPTLAQMVQHAIQLLQYGHDGYLLIVDAGLAGKAAYQNAGERMLREIISLDEAVATARAYAGESALILVAGKQSIGGMNLNGYPFRNDRGLAVGGINAQGVPSFTWATGPGSSSASLPESPSEPSAFPASAAIGVAEDGLILGAGPGSERLDGFHDNTDVFNVVVENL